MNKHDFEKYRYITYLDEVINYSFGGVCFHSIVSISMPKIDYISVLEEKWRQLRKDFDVPDGVCLHFTDIKALLNPTYFNRKLSKRNKSIEDIFCTNNLLDKEKLNNFYTEVLKIIEETDFDVIVTGKRFTKLSEDKHKLIRNYENSKWYVLFTDHLDSLAKYMLNKSYDKYKKNKSKNKKLKILKTKLRYDGDYGLVSRDDFRNAYAHIISNGTRNYSRELAKECFDNLKFVDKNEVGLCTICEKNCDIKRMSHAGNELLDFIAFYISNLKCKDDMINDYMSFMGKSKTQANNYYDKNTKIYIEGNYMYPNTKIKKKLVW